LTQHVHQVSSVGAESLSLKTETYIAFILLSGKESNLTQPMDTTQYPFYRHWDTWCVHYLWHPVMPFEWSRVRNLSSLSTYIVSYFNKNVKFFSDT